jgi:hypothetical protein
MMRRTLSHSWSIKPWPDPRLALRGRFENRLTMGSV